MQDTGRELLITDGYEQEAENVHSAAKYMKAISVAGKLSGDC